MPNHSRVLIFAAMVLLALICVGGLLWLLDGLEAERVDPLSEPAASGTLGDGIPTPGDSALADRAGTVRVAVPDPSAGVVPALAGGAVHGRVIEATTQEGLRGFRLELCRGRDVLGTTASDVEGLFRFLAGQRPGDILRIAAPGSDYQLAETTRALSTREAEGERAVILRAHRLQPLTVSGTLREVGNGEVLPFFQLKVGRRDLPAEVLTTDGEGRFESRALMPVGPARVVLIDHPHLQRARSKSLIELEPRASPRDFPAVLVAAGPTYRFDLELPAGLEAGDFTAVRKLESGSWKYAPLREGPSPWARFGDHGSGRAFEVSLRSSNGLWYGSTPVPEISGFASHPIPFSLEQRSIVRGRVLDEEGRPLLSVALALGARDGNRASTKTDAWGDFEFLWMSPGAYTLRAKLPGFLAETADVEAVSGSAQMIELTLKRDG